MKKLLLLSLIIVFWVPTTGWTQQNDNEAKEEDSRTTGSAVIIQQARQMYDEGQVHEIHTYIEKALYDNSLTKEDQIEAYKLLVLSYIYLDQPYDADETMLELLDKSPEFETNETDPTELLYLWKSFRTWPIFRIGIKGGGNMNLVNVTGTFSHFDENTYSREIKNGISWQGGLYIEKDFGKVLTLSFSPLVNSKTFSTEVTGLLNHDPTKTKETTHAYTSDETRNQFWIVTDLSAQYRPFNENKNVVPYVALGPSFQFLINETRSRESVVLGGASSTGPDAETTEFLNSVDLGARIAVGLKLKVFGAHYLTFEGSYTYGFNNNTKQNYGTGGSSFFNPDANNDMTSQQIRLSIGFLYQWFKPMKLTK